MLLSGQDLSRALKDEWNFVTQTRREKGQHRYCGKGKKGTQSSEVANNRVWEGQSRRENPSPLVFSHWEKNFCFQKTGGQYYYLRDN